jgi:arylformamidase
MKIEHYPEQEPLSENGKRYTARYLEKSQGVEYQEAFYDDLHPSQGLAIVRSRKPNGKVLVFMHGGGWTNGYKELMVFMGSGLADAGITFVSLGYRLAPATLFPDGWLDAAKGLQWVYRHIAEYGGDSQQIFIGGWSAGGHYASLLATRDDWKAQLQVPDDIIKGVVNVTGVFDFTPGNGMSVRPRFLGPADSGNEFPASPLFHASPDTPPMLLTHGGEAEDFPHLVTQAKKLECVLKGKRVDVERHEFAGYDHFTLPELAGEKDGPWQRLVLSWMERHTPTRQ